MPLCFLAFALLGLRQVNGSHGRELGDALPRQLIGVARSLLQAIGSHSHLDGSECLVLLWDQPLESARSRAKRILAVAGAVRPPRDRPDVDQPPLTRVVGVSLLLPGDGLAMVTRVEQALGQCRSLGGSQLVVR